MDKSASKDDVCFVVSPIGQNGSEARTHADWVLEGIIKPAFEDFPSFRVERSDHISTPGQINAQVIDRLLNSRLVIADLSLLNPNVFYEIGIRHMVEKPIIHLQREEDTIPFDVAIYRSIKFSLKEISGLKAAEKQLAAMIRDVLAPDYQVNNPVVEARGRVKLKESATPEQQILLEDMARLKSRMESLETMQRLSMLSADNLTHLHALEWNAHTSKWKNSLADLGKGVSLKNLEGYYKAADIASDQESVIEVPATGLSQGQKKEIYSLVKGFAGASTSLKIDVADDCITITGPRHDMSVLVAILQDSQLAKAAKLYL